MITTSLIFLIAIKAFNNISKKVSFLSFSPLDFLSSPKSDDDKSSETNKSLNTDNNQISFGKIFNTLSAVKPATEDKIISLQIVDSYLFSRIVAIVFIYSGLININFFYIQSIGSGIGLFSGLFYITQTSIMIETLIFIVGGLILLAIRPNNLSNYYSSINTVSYTMSNNLNDYKIDKNINIWNRPGMLFDFNNLIWKENKILSYYKLGLLKKNNLEWVKIHLNYFLLGYISNNFISQIKNKYNTNLINGIEGSELIKDSEEKTDYSIIVLFSALGSSFLISSNDLISMYLSIELQSFALYVLATLYKNSESSTAAGLKYFLLGGLSSSIILLGSGLIYSYSGLTDLELISSLNNILYNNIYINSPSESNIMSFNQLGGTLLKLDNQEALELTGINLGFILIFVGLLFKIAAAPLHNWSPDVYDETPTIITTWLTIIPKLSIVILLLDLCFQFYSPAVYISANSSLDYFYLESVLSWNNSIKLLLILSGILSLIIGTVVGLSQIKIKRLLAYSTISHIGFILIALAIKSSHSIDSLLFYIVQYTITNLNIFLILLSLSYILKRNYYQPDNNLSEKNILTDIRYISEIKGLLYKNPFLSFSLIICLFSLAGIPPLLGFFAKQFTLYAAVQSNFYFISIIAIITSVISASYYLKLIKINLEESNISDLNNTTALPLINEINGNIVVNKINSSKLNKFEVLLGYYFSGNTFKSKVLPYVLVITSNICSIISVLTIFIMFFVLKPSIILSSTGVLSLHLWGFFT